MVLIIGEPRMVKLQTTTSITRYFTGAALTKVREDSGMNQTEFAERCGWTQQFQSKIELPGILHKATESVKDGLLLAGVRI